MKRYMCEVAFDIEDDAEELSYDQEGMLHEWLNATLDNGWYDKDGGFPEGISTGYAVSVQLTP